MGIRVGGYDVCTKSRLYCIGDGDGADWKLGYWHQQCFDLNSPSKLYTYCTFVGRSHSYNFPALVCLICQKANYLLILQWFVGCRLNTWVPGACHQMPWQPAPPSMRRLAWWIEHHSKHHIPSVGSPTDGMLFSTSMHIIQHTRIPRGYLKLDI